MGRNGRQEKESRGTERKGEERRARHLRHLPVQTLVAEHAEQIGAGHLQVYKVFEVQVVDHMHQQFHWQMQITNAKRHWGL